MIRRGRAGAPNIVWKLKNGEAWTRNDINADSHISLAKYLAYSPAREQDTVMGPSDGSLSGVLLPTVLP